MTKWRELTTSYRSLNRAEYPELDGYTRDDIYEDCMVEAFHASIH